MVLWVFGIEGHGKGEINHVGDLAKVAIRQAVALGKYFNSSEELLEFLSEKFNDSESLSYVWKEIEVSQLDEARAANKKRFWNNLWLFKISLPGV